MKNNDFDKMFDRASKATSKGIGLVTWAVENPGKVIAINVALVTLVFVSALLIIKAIFF